MHKIANIRKLTQKTQNNPQPKKRNELVGFKSLTNLLDCSFHSMGQSLIAEETLLPLYISNFTSSKLVIGIIPFIEAVLFSLPQLFNLTRPLKKFKSTKSQIIFFGILERLPWLFLGILTLFIPQLNSAFMLVCFFSLYSFFPLWFNFIKKTIPDPVKGSFWGTALMLKKIFGLVGGLFLLFILNSFSFPYNFSYTFIAAFIIMSVSLLFFSLNQNLPKTRDTNEEHSIHTISSLISILKNDTEFFFLCLAFIFSTMLFSIIPFFSLYAKDKFNVLDVSGGIFTVIFFLGQTVGSIVGGHLGNKHDYKKTMVLSIVFGMLTILFVMFSNSVTMYFTSFFFVGFSLSARKLSFLTFTTSATTEGKTPIYVAITNNITMPFQILFPLLAGLIVEYLSYNTLFLLCLSFLVLSFFSLSLGSLRIKDQQRLIQLEQF
jgi:hypothetical protein